MSQMRMSAPAAAFSSLLVATVAVFVVAVVLVLLVLLLVLVLPVVLVAAAIPSILLETLRIRSSATRTQKLEEAWYS